MTRPGVLRTVVFGVALFALLVVATSGAAQPFIQVLFVTYVVIATIWVRAQYEESLDGDAQLLSKWMAVGIAVLGLVLVAIFVITRVEGVGLAGAILFYFGIGSFVMSWRATESHRKRWGLWLLFIGSLAAAVGFFYLGDLRGWLGWLPLALAALALLLLLPMGMALLAEEAIRWLADDRDHVAWRVGGIAGGLLVFVLVAWAAVRFADPLWVLVPLVVLGLLVVALASSTQADIAAILGVIALMGVTPIQATKPAVLDPRGRSDVLVALGDSYMSGGASICYQGTDEGGGNQCRRSPTAWAAMAGLQRPCDAIAFLACSGARTANVRTDPTSKPAPHPQEGEPGTQLAQYRALQAQNSFTPRLVVLSIGGNDAGSSTHVRLRELVFDTDQALNKAAMINRAVTATTGAWIWLTDADCLFSPDSGQLVASQLDGRTNRLLFAQRRHLTPAQADALLSGRTDGIREFATLCANATARPPDCAPLGYTQIVHRSSPERLRYREEFDNFGGSDLTFVDDCRAAGLDVRPLDGLVCLHLDHPFAWFGTNGFL
jgi:GDSL-like Lipase/Acylhydrolase family